MRGNLLLIAVQLLLAAVLVWTCFCRLVKTDADTYREVRWAILFEGAAAGIVFGAPLLPLLMPQEAHWRAGTTPLWCWIVLLGAVTIVQMVTAKHWVNGRAPAQFQRPSAGAGIAFGAMLLVVGFISAGPGPAIAQAADADGWRHVEGGVAYVPPGGELRCTNERGCVAFTVDGLRDTLRQAAGNCGLMPAIPQSQPGRGT